uniref:snRNA-activating protein complex subunit 3 n=1 Tax=Eptatretus burgeri TaxID=7764 RepID=A0A8C4N1Z3_EPTBU
MRHRGQGTGRKRVAKTTTAAPAPAPGSSRVVDTCSAVPGTSNSTATVSCRSVPDAPSQTSSSIQESTEDRFPTMEVSGSHSTRLLVSSVGAAWRRVLSPSDLELRQSPTDGDEVQFARDLGVSVKVLQELRSVCSEEAFLCPAEERVTSISTIPEDVDLLTFRLRKQYLNNNPAANYQGGRLEAKIDNMKREMELQYVGQLPEHPQHAVQQGEVLLAINVYYPIIKPRHKDTKPHQVFYALGCQRLTELRDAVSCIRDMQLSGEFSNTPNLAPDTTNKDLYKSAFFFIDGTFYNDMRYPSCRDLSKIIIEWAQIRDDTLAKACVKNMNDVTFGELRLKIGYPYLYCHQGNCEHIVIFKDIRLVNSSDCQDRSLYPLLMNKHFFKCHKCYMCKMYTARRCLKHCFEKMEVNPVAVLKI